MTGYDFNSGPTYFNDAFARAFNYGLTESEKIDPFPRIDLNGGSRYGDALIPITPYIPSDPYAANRPQDNGIVSLSDLENSIATLIPGNEQTQFKRRVFGVTTPTKK